MKTENVVKDKSFAFAIRIVRLYQHLTETKKEFVLSKQVLRCGTSIGANIEEAVADNLAQTFSRSLPLLTKKPEKPAIGFDC